MLRNMTQSGVAIETCISQWVLGWRFCKVLQIFPIHAHFYYNMRDAYTETYVCVLLAAVTKISDSDMSNLRNRV